MELRESHGVEVPLGKQEMNSEDNKPDSTVIKDQCTDQEHAAKDRPPGGTRGEPGLPQLAYPQIDQRKFSSLTRRELLKVAPVLALGGLRHSHLSSVAAQKRSQFQRLGIRAPLSRRAFRQS